MSDYQYPHCNTEVLHAPGTCRYCDEFPDRQAMRTASGTSFTPAEANGWHGNVAQPGPRPPVPERSWSGLTTANGRCARPAPRGWRCRRYAHPDGTPCALEPRHERRAIAVIDWFRRLMGR